jgi:hypothetical protein
LLSISKRTEAQVVAKEVGYIELANVPDFNKTFAKAMYIG